MVENPLAPIILQGIDEDTDFGSVIDLVINQQYVLPDTNVHTFIQAINTSGPFMLTGIYVVAKVGGEISGGGATPGNVFVKPYDGQGNAMFTDFSLTNQITGDPFIIMPPRPFQPNEFIRFDMQSIVVNLLVEVAFRGYTFKQGG
jgi:hypothetical protein